MTLCLLQLKRIIFPKKSNFPFRHTKHLNKVPAIYPLTTIISINRFFCSALIKHPLETLLQSSPLDNYFHNSHKHISHIYIHLMMIYCFAFATRKKKVSSRFGLIRFSKELWIFFQLLLVSLLIRLCVSFLSWICSSHARPWIGYFWQHTHDSECLINQLPYEH